MTAKNNVRFLIFFYLMIEMSSQTIKDTKITKILIAILTSLKLINQLYLYYVINNIVRLTYNLLI